MQYPVSILGVLHVLFHNRFYTHIFLLVETKKNVFMYNKFIRRELMRYNLFEHEENMPEPQVLRLTDGRLMIRFDHSSFMIEQDILTDYKIIRRRYQQYDTIDEMLEDFFQVLQEEFAAVLSSEEQEKQIREFVATVREQLPAMSKGLYKSTIKEFAFEQVPTNDIDTEYRAFIGLCASSMYLRYYEGLYDYALFADNSNGPLSEADHMISEILEPTESEIVIGYDRVHDDGNGKIVFGEQYSRLEDDAFGYPETGDDILKTLLIYVPDARYVDIRGVEYTLDDIAEMVESSFVKLNWQ